VVRAAVEEGVLVERDGVGAVGGAEDAAAAAAVVAAVEEGEGLGADADLAFCCCAVGLPVVPRRWSSYRTYEILIPLIGRVLQDTVFRRPLALGWTQAALGDIGS